MISLKNNQLDYPFLAELLLAQAGVKTCDCDCPCSCLKVVDVEIDVNKIVIITTDGIINLHAKTI